MIKKSWLVTMALFILTNIACVNATGLVHVKNSAGTTITTFSGTNGTAIQGAINYAYNNGYPKVYLESGTYMLDTATTIGGLASLKASLFLPDAIELYGDSSSKPVLQIHSAISTRDAFLGVCASFDNRDTALTSVKIHHLVFQAVTSGTVKALTGIWTGKADAATVRLYDLEVYNTSLSAILVGWVSDWERDPVDSSLSYVRQCNGKSTDFGQIYNNTIDYVGGDGICVIGKYYDIKYNSVQHAATNGVGNGITLYSKSSDIIIQNNTLQYNNCGIGLDGSCPACLLDCPEGMDYNAFRDQEGEGNEKGFISYVLIQNNGSIYNNTYGVILFRSKNCRVYGNSITRSSVISASRGVTLEDTRDSFVAGNTISKQAKGVYLWSVGCSLYYTQWNGIGLTHDLDTWNNTYSGNTTNIATLAEGAGVVANNTIRD